MTNIMSQQQGIYCYALGQYSLGHDTKAIEGYHSRIPTRPISFPSDEPSLLVDVLAPLPRTACLSDINFLISNPNIVMPIQHPSALCVQQGELELVQGYRNNAWFAHHDRPTRFQEHLAAGAELKMLCLVCHKVKTKDDLAAMRYKWSSHTPHVPQKWGIA